MGAMPDWTFRAAPTVIGQQSGEAITNIESQFVINQQESFLRDIAASRTRARRLIVAGFLLFVAGGGVYGWVVLSYVISVNRVIQSSLDSPSVMPNLLGPDVGGVPIGALGFAAAGIGMVLLVVGIVLHVVAASRRRQVLGDLTRMQWGAPPPARR